MLRRAVAAVAGEAHGGDGAGDDGGATDADHGPAPARHTPLLGDLGGVDALAVLDHLPLGAGQDGGGRSGLVDAGVAGAVQHLRRVAGGRGGLDAGGLARLGRRVDDLARRALEVGAGVGSAVGAVGALEEDLGLGARVLGDAVAIGVPGVGSGHRGGGGRRGAVRDLARADATHGDGAGDAGGPVDEVVPPIPFGRGNALGGRLFEAALILGRPAGRLVAGGRALHGRVEPVLAARDRLRRQLAIVVDAAGARPLRQDRDRPAPQHMGDGLGRGLRVGDAGEDGEGREGQRQDILGVHAFLQTWLGSFYHFVF